MDPYDAIPGIQNEVFAPIQYFSPCVTDILRHARDFSHRQNTLYAKFEWVLQ